MQYQVHDGTADDTVRIVTNWSQMKSWESNTPKKPMYMVSFKVQKFIGVVLNNHCCPWSPTAHPFQITTNWVALSAK